MKTVVTGKQKSVVEWLGRDVGVDEEANRETVIEVIMRTVE